VIDGGLGRAVSEIQINTISASVQHSHIRVAIDGVPDAINLVKTLLVPWRKQQQKNLPLFRKIDKPAEIESESDGADAEAKRLRSEFTRALAQLTSDLLTQAVPALAQDDRKAAAKRLLPYLQTLTLSTVEMAVDETVPAHAVSTTS
jgi:hypothetical protein